MTLDDRKSAILRAVVQQYIETAQPVGSTTIARRPEVSVSSATVRNDMHVLEEEGYLDQPHTSAGRIPTEKGYRFFVDALTGTESLSPANVARVSQFFAVAHGELEQMLRETSHLLSTLTGTAAVVTGEKATMTTIRSVQLVELSAHHVMTILVTSDGVVLKRTLDVSGPELRRADAVEGSDGSLDPDELIAAQQLLNELVDRELADATSWTPAPAAPGAALAGAVLAALVEAAEAEGPQVYVDGTSRIAGSFDARETIEAVLTVLERQFVVVGLLKGLVDGGLTVAIGSETGVAPLAECSLVVAPYRSEAGPAGAIAVLGPTRMDYAETVSAVAEVSHRLSRLLTEG
jgi:heat-inducible transcriptional repressor